VYHFLTVVVLQMFQFSNLPCCYDMYVICRP